MARFGWHMERSRHGTRSRACHAFQAPCSPTHTPCGPIDVVYAPAVTGQRGRRMRRVTLRRYANSNSRCGNDSAAHGQGKLLQRDFHPNGPFSARRVSGDVSPGCPVDISAITGLTNVGNEKEAHLICVETLDGVKVYHL